MYPRTAFIRHHVPALWGLLCLGLLLFLFLGLTHGRVTASTTPDTSTISNITTVELETTADTWLEQAAPSSNYGTAVNLHVSRNASNQERVTLLAFDTTPLPDNIVVISATVELFNTINVNRDADNAPQTGQANDLRAEAVLGGWTEGGTTWNSRPPSSYLNDPPTSWVAYGWTQFDVTNIVQSWVEDGLENHGILLRAVPGEQMGSFYFSRETNAVPVLKIAYEPAPPSCEPLAVMVINGPTEAKRGISYTYDATISPVSTTGPISYTWTSEGQPTQTTPTAVFSWDTNGNKTVNLTVQNCGGQTSNNRQTLISDPAPNCPVPLTDLQISGPTTGISNRPLLFEAIVGPDEATTPISFHWQVTGQPDRDTTGDLLADSLTTTFGMGPKEVTVTAENCGGTFIRRHALYVDPLSALPDLRITSMWYDSEAQRIGYILQNQGGTAVPAGHQTDLFIAGTYQQSQTIGQSLPAGGVRVYYFNHNWSCGVSSVPLMLRADALGDVSENVESNNEHYASWPCDLVPPTLLSGPIISDVTETTATVSWQTSESTHGRVEYGQTSYAPYSQDTPHFTGVHTAELTGLQAGRTYRVRVFAEDNGDNEINSDWVYFQTSPPGTDPPQITGISVVETPGSPYEMFTVQATLADATYVDRVAFYFDGALIGTQYGSFENSFYQLLAPHTLGYGRDDFYRNSGHTLEVVAYSIGGANSTLTQTETFDDPGTFIRTAVIGPGDNHKIIFDGERVPAGTTEDVIVWASQYDWACTIDGQPQGYVSGLRCSDANPQPVDEMRLYFSNSLVETHVPTADQFLHLFELDLSNKTASESTLRFQAVADTSAESINQTLVLEQGEPQLRVTRAVSRQDNLFTITLTLHNDGEGSAEVDEVRDMLQGFVALAKDNRPGDEAPADLQAQANGYYIVSYTFANGHYWLNAPTPSVRINLLDSDDAVTIAPGDSFTMQYEAIPVIYPQMSPNFYRIGVDENGHGGQLHYTYAGQSGNIEADFYVSGNTPNGPLTTAVEAAFASSDYLLVTNLYRLETGASNANQIPDLLMDMARLAKEADGVIALPANLATAANIDDLLEPNGFWYESLHPNFRQTLGGYVLFVGEEEIIPVQGGGWGVDYSDLRYASTGGAARPELVLGRITGDNIANLRRPIQAAASFHRTGAFFDGSHALIWSGRSDGEGTFWSNVKGMDSRLSDRGTAVTRFRGKDYSNETDLLAALQQNSTGRDWIIYRGHGYRYGFADVGGYAVRTDTVNTLNLNARPVVLALACTTGDFRQNSDGDNSIGEAFLANGAAVFVGSIETSNRARNSSASRAYFNRWHDGRPVGEILADIMRDHWGDSSWWWSNSMTWERWAYDYHNFGDPKYGLGVAPPKSAIAGDGGETTAVSLTFNDAAATADQSAATINVTLPDLEIIALDEGWHEVILPEGNQLGLRDDYAVPVQTIIQTFPAGVRVRDVTLNTQGGLVPFTGLNIQSNYFQLDGLSYFNKGEAFIGPERPLYDPYDGWFPAVQQPYQWRVLENPDGSSDLRLTIYPFYYNPDTTDGRFYKTWQFEVTTVNSNVALEGLTVPTTAEPGDQLPVELLLSNSGTAQDVVVTAEVLSIEGEPLAGLPLRSVDDLVDTAVVSLNWDTTGLPAGDYRLNILVTSRKGQTLAQRDEVVTLGRTALGVAALTANPSGQIAYTVGNTGTVAIDGTAVIHVQNDQMETVAMFSQAVPVLAPNASQAFNSAWATGNVPNGDYRVSVFVSYDGTASAIASANVTLGERAIYLPLITRP